MKYIPVMICFFILNSCAFNNENTIIANNQNKFEELRLSINNIIQDENIPGASIGILVNDSIVFNEAFGYTDSSQLTKVNSKSIFPIASVSKFITAISILMLESQGKLTIEDPITKYFPELSQDFSAIRIKHLLNHTSGIKNMPFKKRLELYKKPDMKKSLLEYFQTSIIRDKPEVIWEYSNITYMMLSFLIESVSEQSFNEFINQQFVETIQLTETGLCESPEIDSTYKFNYYHPKLTYLNPKYTQYHLGAGGICSSTGDLLKIVDALQSGKLLNQEKTSYLCKSTKLKNGMEVYYGLGTKLGLKEDVFMCGHTGGHSTNHATLLWYPNKKTAVVVLNNSDPGNAPKLARVASISVLDFNIYKRKKIDGVNYSGTFNWAGDVITYKINNKDELIEKIDYGETIDELTYFYIGNHSFHNAKYNTTVVFGVKNNESYYVQTFNHGIYVDMDIATRID